MSAVIQSFPRVLVVNANKEPLFGPDVSEFIITQII